MSTSAKPVGTSGSTVVFVILGLMLVPVVLIGGCCIGCVGCASLTKNDPSAHPLVLQSREILKADPQVRETFGEVADPDFNFERTSIALGDYREYYYDIETSMAKGKVIAMGSRVDGEVWVVEEILVEVEGGETIEVKIETPSGEVPTDDGIEIPADDGPAPADDGPEPADDGLEPADDGPEPADDGPAPADDGPEPADDGPEPADDGPEPADDGTAPEDGAAADAEAVDAGTTDDGAEAP